MDDQVYQVEIYLTDDPLNAEEVNIEILSVVLVGEEGKVEIELNTISGIYNLLDFQGDVDTLIAAGNYDLSEIEEIRLVLGDDNTIKIDGEIYPLSIPSGSQSGLKIIINEDLLGQSLVSLLIDFDACKSVKENNGKYVLSPVIHYKGDRNVKSLDLAEVSALDSCFVIEVPIEVKNLDGSVSQVSSLEDLRMLISEEQITGVVYPLNIIDEEGNSKKVNNARQAEKLIMECIGDAVILEVNALLDSILICYTIDYPLSVKRLDGSTVEVFSDVEFRGIQDALSLVYPFQLIDADGSAFRINNENQLDTRIKNCEKEDEEEEEEEEENEDSEFASMLYDLLNCYDLEFPLSVLNTDSMEVVIDSLVQLTALSESETITGFVFDIIIIDGEGKKKTINNSSQLNGLINNCKPKQNDAAILNILLMCYELQFPVKVVNEMGEISEITELNALTDFFINNTEGEFVFPFTVINPDGTTLKVQNRNKLNKIIAMCKG
jgi:hypothetical protein